MRVSLKVIKIPSKHMNSRLLEQAIESSLNGQATAVKVDFDTTTQTWENRPEFTITKPDKFIRVIGTTAPVYGFLDHGTRKNYPIRPKRPGGLLVFQQGYNAKTQVGVIGSRDGGKFGPTVTRKEVIHPGIDKRDFSKEIAKKWLKLSPRMIQRAIDSLV